MDRWTDRPIAKQGCRLALRYGVGAHVQFDAVRRMEQQRLRELFDDDDSDDDGDNNNNGNVNDGTFVDPVDAVEESLARNTELLKVRAFVQQKNNTSINNELESSRETCPSVTSHDLCS